MNKRQYKIQVRRVKRKARVRKTLKGTNFKPRLCVLKSRKHIQVQLIDDEKGVTLGSTATFAKELKNTKYGKKSKESAKHLGKLIAEIALEKNIKEATFDRGPFKYHGILAELADSARENGLKI